MREYLRLPGQPSLDSFFNLNYPNSKRMKNPRIREGTPMEQARHEAMNVLNTRQFHCGLEVMNQMGLLISVMITTNVKFQRHRFSTNLNSLIFVTTGYWRCDEVDDQSALVSQSQSRWLLCTRSANDQEIPVLKTTMIVESRWRRQKHDYLHRFSWPRMGTSSKYSLTHESHH